MAGAVATLDWITYHQKRVRVETLACLDALAGIYALWYSVLPRLETTLAAVAQLTVPIIALGGGIFFLEEVATLKFAIAACLVLGGVAIAALKSKR